MRCVYCGVELHRGKNASTDHFIPKSKGGTNAASNRVSACKPCNFLKGERVFRDVPAARKWIFKQAKSLLRRMRQMGVRG
jgi:5-methylcytosine-specific restriction endonuclease McrA